MKKRIIITILVIAAILTMSYSPAMAINLENKIKTIEKYKEKLDVNAEDDLYFLITSGPKSHLITEVELIDGNPTQINKISRFLNKVLFHPVIPFMIVKDLTFKINYTTEVKNKSKYSYITAFVPFNLTDILSGNITNVTTYENTPHSVVVKNFTGIFMFSRGKLYRPLFKFFIPARFIFLGFCKRILLPDLPTPTISLSVDPVGNTSRIYVGAVNASDLLWNDIEIKVTNITGGSEHNSFGTLPSGKVSAGDLIEITDLHSGSEYRVTLIYKYTDGIMATVTWTQP